MNVVSRAVYIASPLFSEAEQRFNEELARSLSASFLIFLPQRDGKLLVDLIERGADPQAAKREIFENDLAALRRCDAIVPVLDGRTIDEGVAFELGIAHGLGKVCIGLQTDPRRLLPSGNNPMIDCALSEICFSSTELAGCLTAALCKQA